MVSAGGVAGQSLGSPGLRAIHESLAMASRTGRGLGGVDATCGLRLANAISRLPLFHSETKMCADRKFGFARAVLVAATFAVSATTNASAETAEQRQACMGDAFHFCGSAIPDRNRVFACLADNRNFLSVACRTEMAPYLPADPPARHKTHSRGEQP